MGLAEPTIISSKQKIPFDLKITRLLGRWARHDLERLAWELYARQGNARRSFENRITIVLDRSTTSSVPFLELNRELLWKRFMDLIFNPKSYWYWVKEFKCWHAIIFVRKNEYHQIEERYMHSIGKGLREPMKAVFATSFLKEVANDSEGLVEVNPNYKQHGVDGWIWLPSAMLAEKQKV